MANFGSHSGLVTKLTRTKVSVVEINWRIVVPTGFAESSNHKCRPVQHRVRVAAPCAALIATITFGHRRTALGYEFTQRTGSSQTVLFYVIMDDNDNDRPN